jgi:hypothetical protein
MLRLATISAALALIAFTLRAFTRSDNRTAEAVDRTAGATADEAIKR